MFYAEGKYICSPPTFRVGCKSMRNMRKGESRINMLELANEGLREINILLRLEVRRGLKKVPKAKTKKKHPTVGYRYVGATAGVSDGRS